MKRRLQGSIQRQLTKMCLLPTFLVLVPAAAFFVVQDILSFRRRLQEDLQATAQFIALSTRASLAFAEPESARRIIEGLRTKPEIVAGGIFDAEGRPFAQYVRAGDPDELPTAPGSPGFRFESGRLVGVEPIVLYHERIGTVYLESDTGALSRRAWLHVGGAAGIIAVLGGVAYLLSIRLRKEISDPLMNLAEMARTVSEEKDYSVRAETKSRDEVGVLTDAFNQMLVEIQRQDAALRESEERTRFATEASKVGIFDWHIVSDRIVSSAQTARLLGRAEEAMPRTHRELLQLVHAEDRKSIEEEVRHVLADRGFISVEFRIHWPDGSVHWLALRGEAYADWKGKPIRMTGVVLDVTERRQAEEALRRAHAELKETVQSLEGFCYSIAHDLRAPLRAMQGLTTALLEDCAPQLDNGGQEYARRIGMAASRMDRLIQDLLEYGRLASSEIPLGPVEVEPLLQQLLAQHQGEIIRARASVKVESAGQWVTANPTMLGQALANLLSNALKFTSPGAPPSILLRADPRGGRVRIAVIDDGIGIESDYHERIFRVFERLPGPISYPGTGIGLAIVRKVVERMGGQVGVDSRPGNGSCFWIELGAAVVGRTHHTG